MTFMHLLAERRRRLYDVLANAPIPENIDPCRVRKDRLLDEHAPWAEDILEYYGVPLSQTSTLVPGLRTVYHTENLSVQIAEQLWQVGFRDIDVPDESNRTPLMMRRNSLEEEMELICWLMRKGADIHRPLVLLESHVELSFEGSDQHGRSRALHLVAAKIGEDLWTEAFDGHGNHPRWLQNIFSRLSENSRQYLRVLFSDQSRDSCLCACSAGGCLASTMLQKVWEDGHISEFMLLWQPKKAEILGKIVQRAKYIKIVFKSYDSCESWLANEIIRFSTFQMLELRHTCCWYDPYRFNLDDCFTERDPEEIREIRDEDSEGIELLEELMIEFQNKRGDQELITFLESYWTTRMKEVCRKRGEVDLEKTREIGVVWNECDSGQSDSEIDDLERIRECNSDEENNNSDEEDDRDGEYFSSAEEHSEKEDDYLGQKNHDDEANSATDAQRSRPQ